MAPPRARMVAGLGMSIVIVVLKLFFLLFRLPCCILLRRYDCEPVAIQHQHALLCYSIFRMGNACDLYSWRYDP